MWNLKRNDRYKGTYLQNRSKLTDLENELTVIGESCGEGIVREFGMDMYTVLYLKWITNKDLLCSSGTLPNIMWQLGWKESLGENGYMYTYG